MLAPDGTRFLAPRVRVVHVADYGNAFTGSFVPMLRAAIASARDRGWEAELVFGGDARDRPWIDELEADGIPVRFLPRSRTAAAGGLTRMLADGGRSTSRCAARATSSRSET